MNNHTHIRAGHIIRKLMVPAVLNDDGSEKDPEQPEIVTDHKTINAAKRESRRLKGSASVSPVRTAESLAARA